MSFVSAPRYLALPGPPITWIVEGILPASGFLNVYGAPKTGKSRVVLQMAGAIGNPSEDMFLKWPIKTHGPVWYLQLDTPRSLFQADYLRKFINAGKNLQGLHIADRETDGIPYPFNLLDPTSRAWLSKQVRTAEQRPIAFIIDTLRKAHIGDENDSGVMTNVMNLLEEALRIVEPSGQLDERGKMIQSVYMPAIIIISHGKKSSGDGTVGLMEGNRGSNAVAGAMDCVMKVDKGEIRVEGRSLKETTVHAKMSGSTGIWALDPKAKKSAETDQKVFDAMCSPMTYADWERAAVESGIPESTFKASLRRLRDQERVIHDEDTGLYLVEGQGQVG